MLFPLFSILRQERSFARPPTQFLQLHLKRCHMMEWVSAAGAGLTQLSTARGLLLFLCLGSSAAVFSCLSLHGSCAPLLLGACHPAPVT